MGDIYEIEKGSYVNARTGKPATEKEIVNFKKRREKREKEIEERANARKKAHEEFVKKYKKPVMELLCENEYEDEEGVNHLLNDHDLEYLVWRFSTQLFDIYATRNLKEKNKWLAEVKKKMGKEFCDKVKEGYLSGNHDT